jgi:DNA-binding MarR family transcriptional regulator
MKRDKNELNPYKLNIDDTTSRVFLQFIQTSEAVLKYMDSVLNKADMSIVKLMVLQLLEAHGERLKPSVLAQFTFRDKNDITALSRRMQKDGLVNIVDDEKDRRSVNIVITDKGKQVIKDTVPIAVQAMRTATSLIPDSSLIDLEKTCNTLRQNVCRGLISINNTK